MKIGYTRVSKQDGSQLLDLQLDALMQANIAPDNIYSDKASGKNDHRPGLDACLKALRSGDTLYVWKLDRLGRSLQHLVNIVESLALKDIGFVVLSGKGANIDTSTAAGKLIFGIFASLAEFERELIRERTIAGISSARARGRLGGRKFKLSKNQIKYAQYMIKRQEISVSELCKELDISRQTLYRYIAPDGKFRDYANKVLNKLS